VCYGVSRTTEIVGRIFFRVPWISLVNLILGRAVVPELYHRRDVTVERVLRETRRLLDDAAACGAQRRAFAELRAELGEPGVAVRAAKIILGGGLRPPSSSEGASHGRASGATAPSEASPRIDCAGGARARAR